MLYGCVRNPFASPVHFGEVTLYSRRTADGVSFGFASDGTPLTTPDGELLEVCVQTPSGPGAIAKADVQRVIVPALMELYRDRGYYFDRRTGGQ